MMKTSGTERKMNQVTPQDPYLIHFLQLLKFQFLSEKGEILTISILFLTTFILCWTHVF